ncbi:MAG: hypothetical protein OXB93_01980, partial [Cytophagales bacterium]|nr:hypothetical protein [Cytophagales bacterium]
MRIFLRDINDFLKYFQVEEMLISLHMGKYQLENVTPTMVNSMWKMDMQDSDVLGWLFLDRELFWMPLNSSVNIESCWTRLDLFGEYCQNIRSILEKKDNTEHYLLAGIVDYLHNLANSTRNKLSQHVLIQQLAN